MRSAIHRCLAILLDFYICVSSANAQVAREPCGWRIVISPATGHVALLHPFAGLARVVLVVADFKGIRDG